MITWAFWLCVLFGIARVGGALLAPGARWRVSNAFSAAVSLFAAYALWTVLP